MWQCKFPCIFTPKLQSCDSLSPKCKHLSDTGFSRLPQYKRERQIGYEWFCHRGKWGDERVKFTFEKKFNWYEMLEWNNMSCENKIWNSKHRNLMLRRIDDTIQAVMMHFETESFINGVSYEGCDSIEFGWFECLRTIFVYRIQ